MDDLSTLSDFEDNDGSVAASGQQAPDEEPRVRGFEFSNTAADQVQEVTDRPGDRPETSVLTEQKEDDLYLQQQVSEAKLGLRGDPKAVPRRPGRPKAVPRPQRRLQRLLPKPISVSQDIQKQADVIIQELFPRIPDTERQAILERSFPSVSLSLSTPLSPPPFFLLS